MKKTGKVYLIGAGPGDPDLITLKAAEALSSCDAVVYDRLIPMEWVVRLPERVRRYYVGKSARRHALKQQQINTLLADLASQGLSVARLKGGDPFVFGRGSEEALYLSERGIPFEVIPGITAGIAAAAYAGIPVTHRKRAVFTVLLTGHEAEGKSESQVPWEWLAKAKNGTLVVYMGVGQLAKTVERLIAGGMPEETPAALVERGTTGMQRSIFAPLGDLPRRASQARVKPPAVFIVGDTTTLAEVLNRRISGTLAGLRVMVTRPADQADEMYRSLRVQGAEILPLPTISTTEHFDQKGWKKLLAKLKVKENEGWMLFTSENGVRYFIRQLLSQGFDLRALGGFRIAALGAGTERTLREHHLQADFLPSHFTTDALAKESAAVIAGRCRWALRVRGNLGDDLVEKSLQKAGCEVLPLQVYNTKTASWDDGMRALLREQPPDVITFTSGSTVRGFAEILGRTEAVEIAAGTVVVSIGPMTSEVIREFGIQVNVEAEVHSVPGIVEAVLSHYRTRRNDTN